MWLQALVDVEMDDYDTQLIKQQYNKNITNYNNWYLYNVI